MKEHRQNPPLQEGGIVSLRQPQCVNHSTAKPKRRVDPRLQQTQSDAIRIRYGGRQAMETELACAPLSPVFSINVTSTPTVSTANFPSRTAFS